MYWDLNLCMQYYDTVLVTFHYYVKPKPQLAPPSSARPFPFFHLPIDVQLIVYEHCDAPTLFQLMRTCSRIRHAATKLFWDSTFTDHWYHCPDYWLFQHRTSTYTFAPHCQDFALRLTNIEIDVGRLESQFRDDLEDREDAFRASTATKVKVFWAKVGRVFPSAKHIVLTGYEPRRPNPPPPGESDEAFDCIATVVASAPAHVRLCIAFVASLDPDLGRPPRNTLWQVTGRAQAAWRILDSDWKPTRVLLPNRKWTVSPLGDFKTFIQLFHSALLEMRGIEWLMVESYARYAVQDIIHCPYLECPLQFKEKHLWKKHLCESGHGHFEIRRQSERDPMKQLFCYKHTPDIEKAAIEARQQRLDAQCLEAAKIQRRVGYGWGPPRSEQRRLFEQEFTAQLHKESLFTPDELAPGESSPANQYLENLLVWFCRDHIYHGECSGNEEGHICYKL
jgi:hypothetical protein